MLLVVVLVVVHLSISAGFYQPGRVSTSISSSSLLWAEKKKSLAPPNEFSRVIQAGQVTERRPVLCKIVAKEPERKGLAVRFDIYEIVHLAANITVTRQDAVSLLVEGTFEAQIKDGAELVILKSAVFIPLPPSD
jgi:hypothetical protein